MMPSDWDSTHPKGLLPKEIRDLESKELLEAEELVKTDNKNPQTNPNPSPNPPVSEYDKKIMAAKDPSSFVPDKEILTNPNKPVKTKDQLATLMGTDSAFIEMADGGN